MESFESEIILLDLLGSMEPTLGNTSLHSLDYPGSVLWHLPFYVSRAVGASWAPSRLFKRLLMTLFLIQETFNLMGSTTWYID